MPKCFFNEVDLAALGIYLTVDPNWREAPGRSFPTLALRGRQGVVFAADPTVEPRTLRLPFEIRPPVLSVDGRLQAERQLVAAAQRGLVQIGLDDDVNPPVVIDGVCTGVDIRPVGHPLQSTVSRATVTMLCPDPTWRDSAGQVIAFSSEPSEIPIGVEPSGGLVRLMAPSWSANVQTPKLWYYAASRVAVAWLEFNTTLTAGTHFLEIDLDRATAVLSASGTRSNATPLISDGDFFAIDPDDADPLHASYPLLAVTAAAGTPSGTWLGHRRWP